MKKEFRIFFTTLMFLTRIRVPGLVGHNPHSAADLQAAPKYFPFVGWIVATGSALIFLVFARYAGTDAGILASMIGGLLLTGAFHEDGFADVCDGFGGGWTKENILLIMKDSRIGVFGTIGLIAVLGSKFVLLRELVGGADLARGNEHDGGVGYFILCLVAAHGLSRLMPVFVIRWWTYAGDPRLSKGGPMVGGGSASGVRLSSGELAIAMAGGLIPFLFLPWSFLLVVPAVVFVTYRMIRYFAKWIGGYTGDCLGAIQQVSEIVVYLGFIIAGMHAGQAIRI
jgi:adenosylcobinamide-GDP ribazoletransferase